MSFIEERKSEAGSACAGVTAMRERLRSKLLNSQGEVQHPDTLEAGIHAGTDAVESSETRLAEAVDAAVEVYVNRDRLTAYVRVTPPMHGGFDIDRGMLERALAAENIHYGIDHQILETIVDQKPYMEKIAVAAGRPPETGENGEIIDLYERQKELRFKELHNGSIDFKTLNLITAVEAGTVLCEIRPPGPGRPGKDVYGEAIAPRQGKAAYIPQGSNTVLSPDGFLLLAAETGNLVFKNNKFVIDRVYEVRGNVDNSIGNIDFPGDVQILGDVFEGFSIKAKGNVTVYGRVEGASIFSENNIILQSGMNGMNKGELIAGGNLTSNYLENCTIRIQGDIHADSIVNSNVLCNGSMFVSGKRGAILGGSCSVHKMIEAKSIGGRTNLLTTIVLGVATELIAEKVKIIDEIEALEKSLEYLVKSLDYLESKLKNIPLTPERQKTYDAMKREKPVNLLKQGRLKKRLVEINQQIDDVSSSRLKCGEIFPHTKITIGNATMTTQTLLNQCMMFYSEGEVKTAYY